MIRFLRIFEGILSFKNLHEGTPWHINSTVNKLGCLGKRAFIPAIWQGVPIKVHSFEFLNLHLFWYMFHEFRFEHI